MSPGTGQGPAGFASTIPTHPPLSLPDTECGQQKAFCPAELSLFFPSLVSQDITFSTVHLESLGSFCCQLHFATGVCFFHYSSSESPSFPAVHVVSEASLHCSNPCSPLLHTSCLSAYPALSLPSPSNNKLQGSPWPALCAVHWLPAAFSACLRGTCCAGALASAVWW